MTGTLGRSLALFIALALSPVSWADYIQLGNLGLETVVETGEITDDDFVGVDWYTEPGEVDEAFFYFDVYDFTALDNMTLTVTVDVDPSESVLFPYVYLFRQAPGKAPNLPDVLNPISIWTKFDDTETEVDFYVPPSAANPDGPMLADDQGALQAVFNVDITLADPDYRLMVTGSYYEVTGMSGQNFWDLPDGTDRGSYTVTITGTRNQFTLNHVPEPRSTLLFLLGLLALWLLLPPAPVRAVLRSAH